ncbi:MAG: YdeI/OmpD-associated family protein [Woeseiaceae bacterium]|nr:YdeI/OmpD-associated family protein [Woeseiaceae bacterium]
MKRYKTVDDYISNAGDWQSELEQLRGILQSTPLVEEVKWGAPCYTHNGKNVVGLAAFKGWVCLWFHQGALLKDSSKVLVNAQEGKTKALRQWRMTSARDIRPGIIKRYVKEAIGLVDAGKEIKAERGKAIAMPDELGKAMRRYKGATAGFRSLTPGKQREYTEYIATAKRDDTKQKRIDKVLPMIASGVGLNDKYRNC